jgi:hypothetical protein
MLTWLNQSARGLALNARMRSLAVWMPGGFSYVELADLMVRYADTTVMAFPPRAAQRLTVWPLARLRRNMRERCPKT